MVGRLGLALAAAAALGAGPVRGAEVADEAARSYRIVTADSTQRLRVGETGKLVLFIEPVGKTHVNAQAPLKIRMEAPPGLKLAKVQLGHADAVKVGAEAPRFEVPFSAVSAGRQEAKASLDFYICSDTWCVKQVKTVAIPVDVR